MPFADMEKAVDFIYEPLIRAAGALKHVHGDANRRHPELSKAILEDLGLIPQPYPAIVVAGSKGKGSISSMISAILHYSGLKVGLFSGPDLVDYRERIRIAGKMISEEDFLKAANYCEPAIRKVANNLPKHLYISPLGMVLTIAMKHFSENEIDAAVFECGRGGLYDDTRNVPHQYAVIPPVMTEHLEELGPTIRDIAFHKAGIITPEVTHTVLAAQQQEVFAILKAEVDAVGSALLTFGSDFEVSNIRTTPVGTQARVRTKRRDYGLLNIALPGEFQADNAAVSITACELLVEDLKPEHVNDALSSLRIPGRCQVISHDPFILIDGTIHRKSARYLGNLVKGYAHPPVVGIVAIPENKDYEGVMAEAATFTDKLIVTEASNPHLTFPQDAVSKARSFSPHAEAAPTLGEAVARAERSGARSILILGTQSLVADALRYYGVDTDRIF